MTEKTSDPDRSLDGRVSRLIESADDLCADDEHRREPLLQRADSLGVGRAVAERAYDLAVEEQLPPAYAIALAAAGVSVQPLESARPDVGATEPSEPEWVDRPPAPVQADQERRMRQTFRRVRSLLAESDSPRAALTAFAAEPDIEAFDY